MRKFELKKEVKKELMALMASVLIRQMAHPGLGSVDMTTTLNPNKGEASFTIKYGRQS